MSLRHGAVGCAFNLALSARGKERETVHKVHEKFEKERQLALSLVHEEQANSFKHCLTEAHHAQWITFCAFATRVCNSLTLTVPMLCPQEMPDELPTPAQYNEVSALLTSYPTAEGFAFNFGDPVIAEGQVAATTMWNTIAEKLRVSLHRHIMLSIGHLKSEPEMATLVKCFDWFCNVGTEDLSKKNFGLSADDAANLNAISAPVLSEAQSVSQIHIYIYIYIYIQMYTLDVLNKKYVRFRQDLNFLWKFAIG